MFEKVQTARNYRAFQTARLALPVNEPSRSPVPHARLRRPLGRREEREAATWRSRGPWGAAGL
jgi:hypothetical protein